VVFDVEQGEYEGNEIRLSRLFFIPFVNRYKNYFRRDRIMKKVLAAILTAVLCISGNVSAACPT
jgi:hypothetical protein